MTDVGNARIEVIKSIVEYSGIDIPAGMGLKGADGKEYSLFGIGSVLCAIPFYYLGELISDSPASAVSTMNQIAGAATAVLIFLFSLSLGYSRRASLYTAFSYGLGTFAFFYAKDPGDHALEAFFVLSAIYFMYRFNGSKLKTHLILSACTFGFAFLTRPTSALIIPPLFLLMNLYNAPEQKLKISMKSVFINTVIFLFALLPFLSLSFWYNYSRFGSIFETGYTLMQTRLGIDFFSGTPVINGLIGFLISPGKGFFFYSPIAILFLFSINAFRKKHKVLTYCIAWIIFSYLLFLSRNIYWHGDWAWGPRYIFVLTPFFIIPCAEIFDSERLRKCSLIRKTVIILFAASVAIQISAASVHIYKYFVDLKYQRNVPFTILSADGTPSIYEPSPETHFDWRLSPIKAQLGFIYEIGLDMGKYTDNVPNSKNRYETEPWMHLYDFWWLYQFCVGKNSSGLYAAGALVIIALVALSRLSRLVFQE